ncbi:MAG: hypothetical protein M3384_22320 [Acidobacteriota bacterium]|nr:hypothetical protein [Acidobacteriota bacterium]
MLKNTVNFLSLLLVLTALFANSAIAQTLGNKNSSTKTAGQTNPNFNENKSKLFSERCVESEAEAPDGSIIWLDVILLAEPQGIPFLFVWFPAHMFRVLVPKS